MRILPGTLALLLIGWAGCFGANDGDEGSGLTDRAPVVLMARDGNLSSLAPYTLQLCDYGFREIQRAPSANGTDIERIRTDGRLCDFRVTKPLLNATLFDWTTQHGPGNEVSLAVNPADPLNLAGGAKDYTVSYISDTADCGEFTVWNGHYWSLDGGRIWANDLVPGFVGDPRPSALKGNLCNTDPVSVFDSDGTYWHNGLNYRGAREDVGDPITPTGDGGVVTGSQIFFARSQDKGASFDRITFASYGQNDPGIFNDKNWLAVDPNSDHMIHTWTNFYPTGPIIEFVESFDAGATWTHPAPITPGAGLTVIGGSNPSPVAPTGQFSMPQYDANGDLWVIWSAIGGVAVTRGSRGDAPASAGDLAPTVFEPAHISIDPGNLGGAGCLGKTDFRASVYPVLAVDATIGSPHVGRKYIAWPQTGATGAGIFVSYSDDGDAWSAPLEITAQLPDDQFMPWIDVDPHGAVHVAYYDCSADAGDRNMTMGYAYSVDGGASWAANMWVGQVPFDGDLGHHQTGVPFIGDYIAVDASCNAVHFFWADTRHGRSDVYAATVLRTPDARFAYAPEIAPAGTVATATC